MADGISLYGSGSQVCVIGTEHILVTPSGPGLWIGDLDLSALLGGGTPDILQIRYYTSVIPAGTLRQVALASFTGLQDGSTDALSPHKDVLKSLGLQRLGGLYGWKLTLKQTQGTGRTIPWVVSQVSA